MKPSDRYETPPEIFDYYNQIFRFNLDVCAQKETAKCKHYFTFEDNALTAEWGRGSVCWMNPPYSDPKPWIEKAFWEAKHSSVTTVALLPADTSTRWFKMLNVPEVTLIYRTGRIRFLLDGVRQGSPKFGSIIAIFWPKE